jgi:integrase
MRAPRNGTAEMRAAIRNRRTAGAPQYADAYRKSVDTAFRRQCRKLKIEDLHFHDLRYEGTSRLFEAAFSIEQLALVTGTKDWKMLRRYTHLMPEHLHIARVKKTIERRIDLLPA